MSNQLYANGRIAVMTTKLLGADKFNRLSECVNVPEALKVLSECGYGTTNAVGNDYENVLNVETDANLSLLAELCFDKNALSYFLCKYDYHNAKVLMKRKYARLDGVDGCFLNASQDVSAMKEKIVNDDYSEFSRIMAEACDAVDTKFAEGNRSPQTVDRILDVAMFAEMHERAKRCTSSLVKKLCKWEADTANLCLVYRLKKASCSVQSLNDWFVAGGTVGKNQLEKFWQTGECDGAWSEDVKKFCALCTDDNVNLSAAEATKIEVRNKIVADCADSLSIQPVVSYFLRKSDEIDKVRFVLVSVKNGVGSEVINNALK